MPLPTTRKHIIKSQIHHQLPPHPPMSDTHTEEAHTGPIKTPKQLLVTSILAFVVPVFIIIGLVIYVSSGNKPAAGADNLEKAVAERIQKVGSVEIRDANRPLRSGEDVYKAQCAACHAAGVAGAPKFGDKAAWAPRVALGIDALTASVIKGKNAMPPKGGAAAASDAEIKAAVQYMVSAAK